MPTRTQIDSTQIQSTTVTPGSYTLGNFTVNAEGQLTAASSTTATGTGSVVLAASPTLTGTPLAPTATVGTNTTQVATTAFTTTAVATETTRATTAEALLAPKASPTFTGVPAIPTATTGTNTTQAASTAFVTTAVSSVIPASTSGYVLTATGTAGVAGAISPPALAITATGQSVAITLANRAAYTLTVHDFGAKGDGVTDDTAAFNAYATYIRAVVTAGGGGVYIGFNLGVGMRYLLNGSVNLTAMNTVVFNGNGSTLNSTVTGVAALDAVQSIGITFKDFTLLCGNLPTNGIQIGRMLNGYSGASDNCFQNVVVYGFFTQSAIYNRASETTPYINTIATNNYNSATCYGAIFDGSAYFQITSSFASTYNPSAPTVQDALYGTSPSVSFDSVILYGGTISNAYGPGVWMGNYNGLYFDKTYVSGYFATGAGPGPGAILHVGTGDNPIHLGWNVHTEGNISSDIQVQGIATPTINGLFYTCFIDQVHTSGSTFSCGSGVTLVNVNDFRIEIGSYLNSSTTLFDNTAKWAGNGVVNIQAGLWSTPSAWTGLVTQGGSLSIACGTKFTVDPATGNTYVAGLLYVGGSSSFTGVVNSLVTASGGNTWENLYYNSTSTWLIGKSNSFGNAYVIWDSVYGGSILTANPGGSLTIASPLSASAQSGQPLTITGQTAPAGNYNGGNIVLTPGAATGSGTTGTISLAGAVSISGKLTVLGNVGTITATGSTQATGAVVSAPTSIITGTTSGTSVTMTAAVPSCDFRNRSGATVTVFPPSGEQFDGTSGVNLSITIANGLDASMVRLGTSTPPMWYY